MALLEAMATGLSVWSRGRSGRPGDRFAKRGSVTPFPAFQLEDADGKSVSEHDLLGHPAVVYLARHPG